MARDQRAGEQQRAEQQRRQRRQFESAALQTAAVFAFGHGIVLVALGRAVRGGLELASLAALLLGTLLFSGALVSRHLFGGPSFFAPWGGMLTMLGWLLQAAAALRR